MDVQVLVAAMNQTDDSLVGKMNIQSDAIIGNQCEHCSNITYQYDGYEVNYFNRSDRGVGLNRNVGLFHCKNDCILTFADEDMRFVDGYVEIIKTAFKELPDADAIIFNIKTVGMDVGRRNNQKIKRVHFYNALNYGAARLSVRANSLKRENINFHLCFGGGTIYGSGEDSLFITDMLKHKLKLYVFPVCIAEVDQNTSTWFTGCNEKYLFDKGALYAAISRRWAKMLCFQDLFRHKKMYKGCQLSFTEQYKVMKRGISAFNTLDTYSDS